MEQRRVAIILAVLLVPFFSGAIKAIETNDDTDTRIVEARVVEVAEAHISVIARSGVEHVIAVDLETTKVTVDGKAVSLKDLREGDIATIELDAQKQVKFARNISMRSEQTQVARVRR